MAFDTFPPVYKWVKVELMRTRDRVGYFVLDSLVLHCDPFGWCFPGIQFMSELVGYAPSSVNAKLMELQEREWIKVYTTYNARRRQTQMDYQVSPNVMWIRDELLEHAWAKWHDVDYILPSKEQVKYSLTKYVQPATEPESVPSIKPSTLNQLQEPPPPPNSTSNEGATAFFQNGATGTNRTNGNGAKPHDDNNPVDTQTEQHKVQKQPTGKNSAKRKRTDEGSAAAARDMTRYQLELGNPHAEKIAVLIKDELGTRITQSRAIVDEHGYDRTRAALEFVREERRNHRPIKSPVGLLTWWLKNNVISTEDAEELSKLDEMTSWDRELYKQDKARAK